MNFKEKYGQLLNLKGSLLALKYILTRKQILPDLYLNSLSQLNVTLLRNQFGIQYVLLDKDNTLTLPHMLSYANPNIEQKVNELVKFFGKDNVAIVSNSAGSKDDAGYKEAIQLERRTQVHVIRHRYKKPNILKEINSFFQITGKWTGNKSICVIGDRLLVDVIMGKEYGFFTILVDPIDKKKDNYMVRLIRKFENSYLCKKNNF